VFNFKFSINVDQSGRSGLMLSDFSYGISVDTDPSIVTNFLTVDPFAVLGWNDHALGNNLTPNGRGVVAGNDAGQTANMALHSVAQQSANLGFGWSANPDAPGVYDIILQVYDLGTTNVVAESLIRVIVTPVPVPAALLLLAAAFGLIALVKHRRKA
jgi:hypothetical protein